MTTDAFFVARRAVSAPVVTRVSASMLALTAALTAALTIALALSGCGNRGDLTLATDIGFDPEASSGTVLPDDGSGVAGVPGGTLEGGADGPDGAVESERGAVVPSTGAVTERVTTGRGERSGTPGEDADTDVVEENRAR